MFFYYNQKLQSVDFPKHLTMETNHSVKSRYPEEDKMKASGPILFESKKTFSLFFFYVYKPESLYFNTFMLLSPRFCTFYKYTQLL